MPYDKINLLVTFDENYICPFWTMIQSVSIHNPKERFQIFLLHSAIPQEKLDWLIDRCAALDIGLTPLLVDRTLFQNAPVSERYPQLAAPISSAKGTRKSYLSEPGYFSYQLTSSAVRDGSI